LQLQDGDDDRDQEDDREAAHRRIDPAHVAVV
jgi:hypothetical protein